MCLVFQCAEYEPHPKDFTQRRRISAGSPDSVLGRGVVPFLQPHVGHGSNDQAEKSGRFVGVMELGDDRGGQTCTLGGVDDCGEFARFIHRRAASDVPDSKGGLGGLKCRGAGLFFRFGINEQRLADRVVGVEKITSAFVVDLPEQPDVHLGRTKPIQSFSRNVLRDVLSQVRLVVKDLCGCFPELK